MKTKNILFYLIGILLFSSCDDMFEPAKENTRQLETMVQETDYVYGLLIYAYNRLPYVTTTRTDVATDDAVTNSQGDQTYKNMATGQWTADNNPMTQWDACKDGIQYVNIFLKYVNDVNWAKSAESKQQMFIDRLTGEALGLRAIFYYHLLQAHAGYDTEGNLLGVPLLTEPEDGSSDFNQPRATFAACVQQCFDDCDVAMKLLPFEYADIASAAEIPDKYQKIGAQMTGYNLVFGSSSKNLMSAKIAEAIKAQVALLAASPAYRAQSGVTSEQAAVLCANVLEHIGGIAGLDKDGFFWYSSKNKAKLQPSGGELAEMLWREDRHENSAQESENFPPTLFGSGRVNPSQNLVDAFPMRSGRPITDALSGYNDQDPYTGRDPRLSEYILYNGTIYRRVDIVTGTYPNSKNETDDNLNSIGSSTRTGYYLKKLLRDDVSPQSSSLIEQQHVYPRIRYTEIFLAYAEAANDAWGPKNDPKGIGYTAYDVIKAIRERAGLATNDVGMPLPEGDVYLEECAASQEKMTNLIRNERRIELCFENKRFWDMRRWMLPLNETVRGVKIEKIDEDKDPTADNLKYTYFEVEERKYDNSYQCYGPIPKGELLKWDELKQNKGW